MAKNDNLTDFLTDVADAIRAKKGTTAKINPQNFAREIASISTGGGDTPTPDTPVIGDGKTYLYIKIAEKGRMKVPFCFSQTAANGVTVDWGDGSDTQAVSAAGFIHWFHIYAEVGEYTISLNPSTGCTLGFGDSASNYCIMGSTGENEKVYCNMLQAVEIGKNVTSIADYAFQNCYSLSSIVIPEGVTSIGDYAFYRCYSLGSIVIPENVTSIGDNAFSGCSSLGSIVIPENVTSIGDNAFSGCSSLASVVIPQGVTSIGAYAFSNCYSLVNVVIPDSVTSIGEYAFNYCSGMAYYDFTQSTSVPTLGASVFKRIPSDCKIVVPDSLYDTWIAATNWSTYASQIVKASAFNG